MTDGCSMLPRGVGIATLKHRGPLMLLEVSSMNHPRICKRFAGGESYASGGLDRSAKERCLPCVAHDEQDCARFDRVKCGGRGVGFGSCVRVHNAPFATLESTAWCRGRENAKRTNLKLCWRGKFTPRRNPVWLAVASATYISNILCSIPRCCP